MPYLTTRKNNLKLQLSPGLVASYDIKPGNSGSILGQHTHTHTYLLTSLLSPDQHGKLDVKCSAGLTIVPWEGPPARGP